MDLDQLLDQDTLQAAGQKVQGNHILVLNQNLKEQFGVEYEPVCVAVLVNAQRYGSGFKVAGAAAYVGRRRLRQLVLSHFSFNKIQDSI